MRKADYDLLADLIAKEVTDARRQMDNAAKDMAGSLQWQQALGAKMAAETIARAFALRASVAHGPFIHACQLDS